MTGLLLYADRRDGRVDAYIRECIEMGATASNAGQGSKKSGTSGGGRWEKYTGGHAQSGVRWSDVGSDTIGEAVQAVCAVGDALLLGVVRGGGALTIVICSGENRYKLYANSAMEAEAHLTEIAQTASQKAGG